MTTTYCSDVQLERAGQIRDVLTQIEALQLALDVLLDVPPLPVKTGKRLAKKRVAGAKSIAKQLKRWRAEQDYSLKVAAGMLGVSDATFSHWEHGKSAPNGKNAERVSDLLATL